MKSIRKPATKRYIQSKTVSAEFGNIKHVFLDYTVRIIYIIDDCTTTVPLYQKLTVYCPEA